MTMGNTNPEAIDFDDYGLEGLARCDYRMRFATPIEPARQSHTQRDENMDLLLKAFRLYLMEKGGDSSPRV